MQKKRSTLWGKKKGFPNQVLPIYIGFIRSKNSVYNDWVLGFRWKILKIFIIKLKYEGLYLVIHQEGWLLIDNMKLDDI